MSDLRSKLIRLAHANPDLRSEILPLLKEAALSDAAHKAGDSFMDVDAAIMKAERVSVAAIQKLSPQDQEDAKRAISHHIDGLITWLKKVKATVNKAR